MEYYIHDGTTQSGPFTKEEIKSKYNQPGYFTWKEGMQEWEPVASLFLQLKKESMPPGMAIPASTPAAAAVKDEKSRRAGSLILSVASLVLALALGISSYVLYNRMEKAEEKLQIVHLQGYGSDFLIRGVRFENNLPKIYVQRLGNFTDYKYTQTLEVKYFDAQRNLIRPDNEVNFTYQSNITLDNTIPEVNDFAFTPGASKATAFLLTSMSRFSGPEGTEKYSTPVLTKGDYWVEIWQEDHRLFMEKLSIP